MGSIIHKHILLTTLLEATTIKIIEMTEGAEILHVEFQHDDVCLWEKHNADLGFKEQRTFYIAAGIEFRFPMGYRPVYLGTAVRNYVWHIYELIQE